MAIISHSSHIPFVTVVTDVTNVSFNSPFALKQKQNLVNGNEAFVSLTVFLAGKTLIACSLYNSEHISRGKNFNYFYT